MKRGERNLAIAVGGLVVLAGLLYLPDLTGGAGSRSGGRLLSSAPGLREVTERAEVQLRVGIADWPLRPLAELGEDPFSPPQDEAETTSEGVSEADATVRLCGIVRGGDDCFAVVNGKMVREGDRVGLFRVEQIRDDGVILFDGKRRVFRRLEMFPEGVSGTIRMRVGGDMGRVIESVVERAGQRIAEQVDAASVDVAPSAAEAQPAAEDANGTQVVWFGQEG